MTHDIVCLETLEMDGCICDQLAKARADERERIAAVCRMLLDSGDITPMGARLLTKPRNGGRDDLG